MYCNTIEINWHCSVVIAPVGSIGVKGSWGRADGAGHASRWPQWVTVGVLVCCQSFAHYCVPCWFPLVGVTTGPCGCVVCQMFTQCSGCWCCLGQRGVTWFSAVMVSVGNTLCAGLSPRWELLGVALLWACICSWFRRALLRWAQGAAIGTM